MEQQAYLQWPRDLKVMRVHELALIPQYQTAGAACFDLHAIINEKLRLKDGYQVIERVSVPPGGARTFDTGVAFEVPPGWVMLVFSRSGHGFNLGVRLANCVGVVDSDFRGEVKVKLRNDGDQELVVSNRERIAQAMLMPAPQWNLIEVSELSETERGESGYGSTGR